MLVSVKSEWESIGVWLDRANITKGVLANDDDDYVDDSIVECPHILYSLVAYFIEQNINHFPNSP